MANTYTAAVPASFNRSEREAIGRAIIDFITKRTKKGQGIGGRKFIGTDGNSTYSDSYRASSEFGIAGKRAGKINLTLTGDMLDSLEIIDSTRSGSITVGYIDGEESDKSVWMREKGYDFLGLTNGELQTILSGFEKADAIDTVVQEIVPTVAQSLLRRIIGGN